MIGKVLDRRYKIIKSLSSGAFGYTFLAEDIKRPQNPSCVVKQLKPKETHPDFLLKAKELFDREAEALELLGRHPQIPGLLAHLEIEQEFYLVEEYIPGNTLEKELASQPNKPESEVIKIVSELLKILDFIHQKKIVHRDIKPSNIIRNQENNRLVLIDFGAVMEFDGETLMGTIIGTPGYIAPEQSIGRTGFYSDLYAVGIIGIQALTGINPHFLVRDEDDEIIWQNKNTLVSQEFADILTKMVRTHKGDRYSGASEVLQDINCLENTVSSTMITPNSNRGVNFTQKKILIPSLLTLAGIPLLLWVTTSLNKTSSLNLPLNGKAISDELNEENTCQEMILESDLFCNKYTINGEKNREITIEMNSDDFDPFLILQKPDGDKLKINSDRSINNWNAQIKTRLPQDGKYTVITRTTSPGESGKYTVRAKIDN